MIIQVYADDVLAYDSRLDDYGLLELSTTKGLEISGTATIKMPPDHPAYHIFAQRKTIVTIYKDQALHFRGQVLMISDDFYRQRTITCEGERSFLLNSVARPYLYQDGPAAIFSQLIELHNAQVEAEKQFTVGTVNVTDPNNYVRLESETAEQTADVINKLLERVGGYLVFTTNAEGSRTINWLAELEYASSQVIEFGQNLLDYARTSSNDEMATVIVPYGAKDEETGQRLTIEAVNGGLDFIQDYDAVGLRGVIAKPVYWDDVTTPENLLAKAQQYLAANRNIITSLQLSALDLSLLDASIDSMEVGDRIRVRSKPHNVDEDFRLQTKTENLLAAGNGSITLGKDKASLTGADAMGDYKARNELHKVERNIKADYTLNIAAAVAETKTTLSSLIEQTSEALRLEVSETYTTNEQLESSISTSMTQLSDSFTFLFETLQATVDENDAEARTQFETIQKYIRFEDGNIILGETGNELMLRIENDRISFLDQGAEVAYFSNKQLYVLDGHFINSLQVGNLAFLPRENGNTSVVRVGV